ncbi:MAG: efflux RND transporter permease subunit, partial [Hyphomonas sp.]|nr:efflux RND transporter permease subunit [Hyphomonas sp.]
SSSSTFGNSSVTVEFTEETDIDIAANDLKDAISRISRDLPDDIEDPRVVKSDDNAQAVLRVAVTSADLSVQELTTLVEEEVVDRLTAV